MSAAVINMEMAAWDGERVVPHLSVEMDSDHPDATLAWEMNVELKLLQTPSPPILG